MRGENIHGAQGTVSHAILHRVDVEDGRRHRSTKEAISCAFSNWKKKTFHGRRYFDLKRRVFLTKGENKPDIYPYFEVSSP